ncbi:MAG: peptide-methionine (S)-S-oxide reductase MsrA [Flavobacteriaceae bacterium]|nr:peptide-methionine (S)-S-oxide reductase MsrA [Flavobacteriaceae bacterium]
MNILLILFLNIFFNTNIYFTKNNSKNTIEYHCQEELNRAYFASGCFWCVESIFESVCGVIDVYSGYAGGFTKNPNYYEINNKKTGHAESVEIIYNQQIVSFKTLVKVFFESHDPTSYNSQGPDVGPQYRSIAFFKTKEEEKIITDYKNKLELKLDKNKKIVTEIKFLKKFYYAEDYHQNFKKRNPNNPYILNVSIPRLEKFKNAFPEICK